MSLDLSKIKTADELRRSIGLKTTIEMFIEDVMHCIQLAIKFGDRHITYRIPDRFLDESMLIDAAIYFELLGYGDVKHFVVEENKQRVYYFGAWW